ncbi:MAG: hypothetical protein HY908_01235 [Myxococcales bacterium]|nr:hypothetical protein [Myxococcales bacterium]
MVDRMLAAIPLGRVDRVGSASVGAAALGCKELFTTVEDAFGSAPHADATTGQVVVADVRLTERLDLRVALRPSDARAHAPEGHDAQLVAEAYDRWGDGCARHLEGDFAFAIWDPARSELFCARDRLGVRPLYYALDGPLFACASEELALFPALTAGPRPNGAAMASFLYESYGDAGQTLYEGVRALPPGHTLTVGPTRLRVQRYWSPDPCRRLAPTDDIDYAAQFRDALGAAVARCSAARGPVGVMVSGGLDSTSVAATLAARAPERATTLFHLSFPGLPCNERDHARALSERCGLPLVEVEPALEAAPWPLNGDGQRQPDVHYHPTSDMFTPALRAATARGVRVMLTGHGGDQELRATGYEVADALHRGDFRTAFAAANLPAGAARLATWRALLRQAIWPDLPADVRAWYWHRRTLRLEPDVLTPVARRTLIAQEQRVRAAWEQVPAVDLATGLLCAELVGAGGSYASSQWTKHGRALGVEVRHPFLDRQLVEFLLALPPGQRWAAPPAATKPVLRRAMAQLLPAAIVERTAGTEFSCYVESIVFGRHVTQVQDLLASSRLADAGIVRQDAVRRLIEQRPRSGAALRCLVQLVALELWLRQVSE